MNCAAPKRADASKLTLSGLAPTNCTCHCGAHFNRTFYGTREELQRQRQPQRLRPELWKTNSRPPGLNAWPAPAPPKENGSGAVRTTGFVGRETVSRLAPGPRLWRPVRHLRCPRPQPPPLAGRAGFEEPAPRATGVPPSCSASALACFLADGVPPSVLDDSLILFSERSRP